jgi:adenosylhomocysteine nucleosidase
MRLLFVASAPMEFSGLLKLAKPHAAVGTASLWMRSGRINGHDILMVANGAGRERAAAAVDSATAFDPDAVVSTGFCGALDPELPIAAVVVGTCITEARRKYGALAVRAPGSHTRGVVATVDHVVQTAAEKRALRAEGASVVEMEAAGVASRAQTLGLPFYCVRAVTDTAGEDLANDFNAALREDGQFDTMRIFSNALSRPMARLPELFRLRGNCLRAAKILGEFFANCQF